MEGDEVGGIPVRSAAMRRAVERCELYAGFDLPIVLVGPVGSGKSLLAHVIYEAAHLSGPFTAFTGGGTPPELYYSFLFGTVPGAFTDAKASGGVLQAATDGMVFFDDIALMPVLAQAALLRVMDSGRFRTMGETQERSSSCRIVVATTEEPRTLVATERMLPDFASRLGEFVIQVPALSARPEDILPMAQRFAREFVRKEGLDTTIRIAEDVEALLVAYEWPGNVRELKNVMERAVVHALRTGGVTEILRAHLPERFYELDSTTATARRQLDPELVERTVLQCNGNQSAAARMLKVHRNSIRKYRRRGPHEPGG